jgi:hypothetical protein
VSRDDSILYTGVTSVSNEREPTPREVQAEAKEKARIKLKPAAELILAEIASEKAKVTDISTFVIDRKSTQEEVNVELYARRLYLNYLNGLEFKIGNAIKTKKSKKRRETEDE